MGALTAIWTFIVALFAWPEFQALLQAFGVTFAVAFMLAAIGMC